jgi:polyisoprenoid-binding protein YceI
MSTVQTTRRWTLDRNRSTIEFSVHAFWGLGSVNGLADRFGGTYTVGPHGAALELTLDPTSIHTDAPWLDARLRTAVAGQPQVSFSSSQIEDMGDGTIRVNGVGRAAGKTRAVSFVAMRRELDGDLELETTTSLEHPHAKLHVKARFSPAV